MPLNLKNSKYHKAQRAIEKAWKKSADSRYRRNIKRVASMGDAMRTDKSEYWNRESRRVVDAWNRNQVPYSRRTWKNRYTYWSKRRQRWM